MMRNILSKCNLIKRFGIALVCFSLALLVLLSFSPTAIAAYEQRNTEANDKIIDKIMSYKYARYNFTPDEEKYIAAHPELAARRAEKDVKFLMDEIDKQINMSMNENADYTLLASQTITLGNDATLYSCNTGNKGGSSSLLADWAANYSASSKWADISVTTVGWGDASAWAWVGPQVTVSGTGSKEAYITFNFKGYGSMIGGIGGSATGTIRVSIWDYTRNTETAGYVVWSDTSQNNFRKNVGESFSPTIYTNIEAGHTYAFRFGISCAASQYDLQGSTVDFWNNGPGQQGLDITSVRIDF